MSLLLIIAREQKLRGNLANIYLVLYAQKDWTNFLDDHCGQGLLGTCSFKIGLRNHLFGEIVKFLDRK